MPTFTLPYQASRKWMQSRILAGEPLTNRKLDLEVELGELDEEFRDRLDQLQFEATWDSDGRVTVFDSGVDPAATYGESESDARPMDADVIERVGRLPELPEPTDKIETVVASWEQWLESYKDAALTVISAFNAQPPAYGTDGSIFAIEVEWGPVRLDFGNGVTSAITLEDGDLAVRDAKAAWSRIEYMQAHLPSESVKAAEEAVTPSPSTGKTLAELKPGDRAAKFLQLARKRHEVAQAHARARLTGEPDFEAEMSNWAADHGSERLRLGLEDGYRMHARYLAERLAAEAPGFFAMPVRGTPKDWAAVQSSPSERALRLRRLVEAAMRAHAAEGDVEPKVQIVTVRKPPHQIYRPDSDSSDYPSRRGWDWDYDYDGDLIGGIAKPFEAVVVLNWLGRYHLIGAVGGEIGISAYDIWAVPDISHFHEDGTVDAQDPDVPQPERAKRKPPGPPDDDIPF